VLPTRHTLHGSESRIARVDREQVADGRDIRLQLVYTPHALLDLGNDLRLTVQLVESLALNEFGLQVLQIVVIDVELALEGAIRQAPTALQQGNRLVKEFFKGHR
jgi:hypothetical protein